MGKIERTNKPLQEIKNQQMDASQDEAEALCQRLEQDSRRFAHVLEAGEEMWL